MPARRLTQTVGHTHGRRIEPFLRLATVVEAGSFKRRNALPASADADARLPDDDDTRAVVVRTQRPSVTASRRGPSSATSVPRAPVAATIIPRSVFNAGWPSGVRVSPPAP